MLAGSATPVEGVRSVASVVEAVHGADRIEPFPERYRVDGVIAEGGMATVHRGWHKWLDQPVAIKMLRPEYIGNSEVNERFLQEARAMASLRSRHIARVMDFGTTPTGAPYMIMEYLKGHDLQCVLSETGPLPVPRAVAIAKQVSAALVEAHAHGLIHRDLKPANLFLTQEYGRELVKVIDFGISKAIDKSTKRWTLSKDYLGSPQYMSPEQIMSAASVDERTDIWSLGIVLYEMLTGAAPFSATTLPALCAAISKDSPRLPETVPREVASVVLRCLAKSPSNRYQSMRELGAALGSLFEPSTAGSPSPEPERAPPVSGTACKSTVSTRYVKAAVAGGVVSSLLASAVWAVGAWEPREKISEQPAVSHRSGRSSVAPSALRTPGPSIEPVAVTADPGPKKPPEARPKPTRTLRASRPAWSRTAAVAESHVRPVRSSAVAESNESGASPLKDEPMSDDVATELRYAITYQP